MTENRLLEHILDRLGRAESAEEIFGADESSHWPPGALDTLTKAGLLRRAQPAQVIECTGCEENCAMPVCITPAEGSRPARAFISCDKRDDVGRVPMDMQRLLQWQITGGMLAKAVGQLLGCAQPVGLDTTGKFWRLGLLKDEGYSSQVTLTIEDGVSLKMADHDIPLAEVLVLDQSGVMVDRARLVPFVAKPVMAPSVVEPSEPKFLFRRNRTGTWETRFDDRPFLPLKDTKGLRYIQHLLQNPGQPISAAHLSRPPTTEPPNRVRILPTRSTR